MEPQRYCTLPDSEMLITDQSSLTKQAVKQKMEDFTRDLIQSSKMKMSS